MYASTKSESYHLTEERAADQSVYFLWQFVALGLLYPQKVAILALRRHCGNHLGSCRSADGSGR